MLAQDDLFAMPLKRRVETPAARRTDPATSHQAAAQHTRSGARGRQRAQTAAAVQEWPGQTSSELAKLSGIDRYTLARRLSECETGGEVSRGAIKTCAVTGKKALTWWVA